MATEEQRTGTKKVVGGSPQQSLGCANTESSRLLPSFEAAQCHGGGPEEPLPRHRLSLGLPIIADSTPQTSALDPLSLTETP